VHYKQGLRSNASHLMSDVCMSYVQGECGGLLIVSGET
jgi:hypothetical protein